MDNIELNDKNEDEVLDEMDDSSSVAMSGEKKSSQGTTGGENVRVLCRLRPHNNMELENGGVDCVQVLPDGQRVTITMNSSETSSFNTMSTSYEFEFDKVYDQIASQEEVYKDIAGPLVSEVLNGFNAAIIAYGQTGSGKTYTMQGKAMGKHGIRMDDESIGIIPRMVTDIFTRVENCDPSEEYMISASFVEVYKEKIRDLMSPMKDNLIILEDKNRGLRITDATEVPVKNTQEVLQVMNQGLQNRFVAETNCNTDSSRSHAIFLITIYKRDHVEQVAKTSQLYLVDLAGSEKVSKTKTTGERLDEAKAINTSLLALRQVIYALTSKKKTHIPYRDSKLTRMLQNSFGGNSHCALIINISPNSFNAPETLSTLRFGDRTRHIKNKPKANKQRTVEELTRLLDQANEEMEQQRAIIRQLQSEVQRYRKQERRQQQSSEQSMSNEYESAVAPAHGVSFRELKKFFICPISRRLMSEPVYAMDGYTYDRKSLELYQKSIKRRQQLISPVTKQPMSSSSALKQNILVRTQLEYFKSVYGENVFDGVRDCDDDDDTEPLFWTFEEAVPVEVLHHIFSFLNATALTRCSKVCIEWYNISGSNHLWYRLIRVDYPTSKGLLTSTSNNTTNSNTSGDDNDDVTATSSWHGQPLYEMKANQLRKQYWELYRESKKNTNKDNCRDYPGVMKSVSGGGLYLFPDSS